MQAIGSAATIKNLRPFRVLAAGDAPDKQKR